MKNFQVNLFIVLAVALCGLCVYQWFEQTVQREEIQKQNGMLYDRDDAIQKDTNAIANLNAEVNQMDARISEIKTDAATNEQRLVMQKAQIAELQFQNATFTNEIAQYKSAVDTLTTKLKDAYAGIEQQNETITNLVAQRDDFVQKYNEAVSNRNDVVQKYNDLVKQVEKQQGNQKQ